MSNPSKRTRSSAPSKELIADVWGLAPDVCAACGYESRHLQRCHVVPHALGGSDVDPENFVLLCKRCHIDAPDHRDPIHMHAWVADHLTDSAERARAVSRGVRRIFPLGTPDGFDPEELKSAVATEFDTNVIEHFGMGRVSIGTVEAIGAAAAARVRDTP